MKEIFGRLTGNLSPVIPNKADQMSENLNITNIQIKTLGFLLCITLAHCCAKQTPPNFGVPVYRPHSQDDDNRTKQNETPTRQERSVSNRFEDIMDHDFQGDSEVLNANMLKVLKLIQNQRQEESNKILESNIFTVIQGLISSQINKDERSQNIAQLPFQLSKRTIKENASVKQEQAVQSENLNDRLKRNASEPNIAQPPTEDGDHLDEEAQENQDISTGGWNTAAAVTGFALAAIMLLGFTCFIRLEKFFFSL